MRSVAQTCRRASHLVFSLPSTPCALQSLLLSAPTARSSSSSATQAPVGSLSAALHARLLELKRRHDELSSELGADTSPSLERVVGINKELAQLAPVVDCFAELRELETARASAKQRLLACSCHFCFSLACAGGGDA